MIFQYPEIELKKTGEKICQKCKEKGISVAQLQEYLFIGSNQAIYSWYSGKNLPKLDNLYALAELLEVKIDDLIVKVEKEESDE